MENKIMYILESNHDIEMLMNGKYPHHLKQRVWGIKGHLSNKVAGEYLQELIGDRTKIIALAHLSEENNNPEVALNTLLEHVPSDRVDRIIIATQKERTELINI
jgi:phosphoribosyl 1,2-cyclic phosphodiesterase